MPRIRQANVQRRRAVVQPGTSAVIRGTAVTKCSTKHLAGLVHIQGVTVSIVIRRASVICIRQTDGGDVVGRNTKDRRPRQHEKAAAYSAQ